MEKSMEIENIHFKHVSVRKPLSSRNARLVYNLLMDCINTKTVLDDWILQEWWFEKFVKARNRTVDEWTGLRDENGHGIFRKVDAYGYYKREAQKYGGLLPGYYWSEAKSALRYHIGSLVMNGYLLVLPVININSSEEPVPKIEEK